MNALHGPRWSRSDMHMQHAHPQLGQHACSPLPVVLHPALETSTIAVANQMHMPSLFPLTKSHPCISSQFYVVLHIALDCYERLLQSSGPQQMNVCGYDSYLFPHCVLEALIGLHENWDGF